jgi:hypothetical protein
MNRAARNRASTNILSAPAPIDPPHVEPVYIRPRAADPHARTRALAFALRQAQHEAQRQARIRFAMHAIWTGTLALAAALAASPAHAQVSASVDQRFSDWDRDRNDLLTLDEYRAEARADFDAMDDDANGNVSAEEWEEYDPQADGEMSTAQKISLGDANEDGVLSLAEHEEAVEKRFEDIDANDDDNIGRDELKSPWVLPRPTTTYP